VVIERLEDRHSAVLRTDLDGLVTVETDGKALWFNQMAWRRGSLPLWYPFQADLVH
jgi:beta-lactamase superfamily II metal-dependent hydrolase